MSLIDREAVLSLPRNVERTFFGEVVGETVDVKLIEALPTIEPRAKGHWEVTDAYPHNVYCSECHKRFAQTHWAVWEDGTLPRNNCPSCGADMRQEAPHEP